jgi:hypothetical protein
VGAKACNLAKLRQKLPDWIMVPRSVALPFGTFEAVLTDPANAAVAAELQQIQQQLQASAKQAGAGSSIGSNGSAAAVVVAAVAAGNNAGQLSPVALLARARELVTSQLQPPEGMQQVKEKGAEGSLQQWQGCMSSRVIVQQGASKLAEGLV